MGYSNVYAKQQLFLIYIISCDLEPVAFLCKKAFGWFERIISLFGLILMALDSGFLVIGDIFVPSMAFSVQIDK